MTRISATAYLDMTSDSRISLGKLHAVLRCQGAHYTQFRDGIPRFGSFSSPSGPSVVERSVSGGWFMVPGVLGLV